MPTFRRAGGLLTSAAAAFTLLAAAWAAAPHAHAAGTVEGRGFAAHPPAGFRPVGVLDQEQTCERRFARRVDQGVLELTLASQEKSSLAAAQAELSAGAEQAAAAGAPGPASLGAARQAAQVDGADEAYQVTVTSAMGTLRTLVARRDAVLVTAELRSPRGADEAANEAWDSVLTSLTLESPDGLLAPVLFGLLGALVALALVLTLLRRAQRAALAPVRAGSFEPGSLGRTPLEAGTAWADGGSATSSAVEALAREETPIPVAPAVYRLKGGGFSRADDGLAVFSAAQKAQGPVPEEALRLPEPPRRPAAKPATPARAPATAPPPPKVTVRR